MLVSSNLLNYDIQDTVMNTSIKHPRMVNPGTEQTFIRQNTEAGGLEVHTTDAVIEVDTTQCRESMGYGQLSDMSLLKRRGELAKEACAEYTRRTAQDGEAYVYEQATTYQLKKQKFMEDRKPETPVLKFYPGVPPEVTVNPGTTDIQHHPTELSIDWENTDIVGYQLDRGTVSFDIVQKAYVHFTYMGEPNYFPEPDFLSWA